WLCGARAGYLSMLNTQDDLKEKCQQAESRALDFALTVNGWLWETDAHGRFSFISEGASKRIQNPPETYYGKTRRELAAGSYSVEVLTEIERCEAAREPFDRLEYEYSLAGNAWIRTSGKPCFDRDGQFLAYR